jgi:hypothetical protein
VEPSDEEYTHLATLISSADLHLGKGPKRRAA